MDRIERLVADAESAARPMQVEIIANGGGLNLVRSDGTPQALRVSALLRKHGYYSGPNFPVSYMMNLPLMLETAQAIEAVCPDAWLIQSGNPVREGSPLITRYTNVKYIGLCHGHYGYRSIAAVLGLVHVPAVGREPVAGGTRDHAGVGARVDAEVVPVEHHLEVVEAQAVGAVLGLVPAAGGMAALALEGEFAPEEGHEIVPTREAHNLVTYLLGLNQMYEIED